MGCSKSLNVCEGSSGLSGDPSCGLFVGLRASGTLHGGNACAQGRLGQMLSVYPYVYAVTYKVAHVPKRGRCNTI